MLSTILICMAILAFLCIVFEEITHINKAKTSMVIGCLSWVILFITTKNTTEITTAFSDNLLEIASLWIFLMSTMTFVAYLNSKGLIQMLIEKIFPSRIKVRSLMIRISLFALFLSSFCDNVTSTLVSFALISAFDLETKVKCKTAILVVFAINSGGVSLITGDVTTLMIFLGNHVSMLQLLTLIIPAAISTLFLAFILSYKENQIVILHKRVYSPRIIEKVIFLLFCSTVVLTMLFSVLFDIPPVLTFVSGLGIMFLIGNIGDKEKDNSTVHVMEYTRHIEFDTLFFFLGVLLIVGMLKEIGVLKIIAEHYKDISPYIANYIAGISSSAVDNVPLTAALLKANPELTSPQWLSLTYAVGVGGSLLVIGSASGVVMMSKVKELSFFFYCKYTPMVFIAYTIGYGITVAMN